VWNPKVEKPEDFTTAQIWLKAANGPDNFESIEAGWTVSYTLHFSSFFLSYIHDYCYVCSSIGVHILNALYML
jgi:hypothetical protein